MRTDVIASESYDPYDPYGDPCAEGGGESDAEGDNCPSEFIVIEVSYDDGVTWQTWWEGYATVCG